MTPPRAREVLQAAVRQGLVPAAARLPESDARPWPVLLLTALSAWLVLVPMLLVLGMLFGDVLTRGAGYYLMGALLLAGSVVVLHSRSVPLFAEQLALSVLWVGFAALGAGLFRDLQRPAAAGGLALWMLAATALLLRPWLRVLLGAAAAALTALAGMPDRLGPIGGTPAWLAWHLVLAAWLWAQWLQHAQLERAGRWRAAAWLEPVAAGWLMTALAGLALWAGMGFLVGGSLGGGVLGDVATAATQRRAWESGLPQAGSAALALLAAGWAARRCPALRKPWLAAAALVLVALAWFMPALGGLLLALAALSTQARWHMAGAAALAAAWVVGAFYYQLQWPLAHKALVMLGAGMVLGALARVAQRSGAGASARSAHAPDTAGRRAAIAAAAVLVLGVVNVGIWRMQRLIVQGRPVFVALAPADPRSLMQGDFMRLRFNVPQPDDAAGLWRTQRPHVVLQLDARGVAAPQRLDDGGALKEGELLMELTPRDGRWTLVTDAWYFSEGQAQRWAAARFGEFRVDAHGHALLVGLRGDDLQPL